MTKRHVDIALVALWVGLMLTAIASDWHVGWVAFFAFAAGERWFSFWYRGKPL